MRDGEKTRQARRLRRTGTDAERVLWRRLRDRSLSGRKFRRQQSIGPYIVDFVCLDARLVVEIDGGGHEREADERSVRTSLLRAEGFRVLRFWNTEVLQNADGVLQVIAAAVE